VPASTLQSFEVLNFESLKVTELSIKMRYMTRKKSVAVARRRQRTVYLPEAIDKRIRVRAAQLDTTVSVVVAQALRAYFAAERVVGKKSKPKS
jgi:hypothetical protein